MLTKKHNKLLRKGTLVDKESFEYEDYDKEVMDDDDNYGWNEEDE
jgi:hypothetical protein